MFLIEGSIENGGLQAALRTIAGGSKDGLLAVQGEQDLVSVTFVDGAIVAVDAMNYSMEEALCEVLASRGILAPHKFASVVDPTLGTGRLAGDVLLEAGLVEEGELLEAVRDQVFSQAQQLLRWGRGDYSWSDEAESPYQAGIQPVSVAELLVRSSEELGPDSILHVAAVELDDRFRRAEGETPRVLGESGEWIDVEDAHLWITPTEERVLEALAEPLPASDLLLRLGLDRFELRYAMQSLLARGFVERLDASPEEGPGVVSELLGGSESMSELLGSGDATPTFSGSEDPGETSGFDVDPSLFSSRDLGASDPDLVGAGDPLFSLRESFESAPDAPGRSSLPPESLAQIVSLWASRAMALAFVGLLASQLVLRAQRHGLMFPFFWQGQAADAMEEKFWETTADKIDRALRVYHLLYGRYPDDLEVLVDLDLLAPADLYDSQGRWLAYAMEGDAYRVRPAEGEIVLENQARQGGMQGDLLMDPRFLGGVEEDRGRGVRIVQNNP